MCCINTDRLNSCHRAKQAENRAYQSRDGEVSSMHLLSQPVDFSPGVEEDDSLGDGQCFIQITQGVQLPLLETFMKQKKVTSSNALSAEQSQPDKSYCKPAPSPLVIYQSPY